MQLPKYLEYSPVKLNFTMPSGQLNAKLTASFQTAKDKPAALAISGNLGLRDLVLQQDGNTPLVKFPSFDVVVDKYDVFANRAALKMVKATGTELHLTRNRNGDLNLASLVTFPASQNDAPPKKESTPFNYHVEEILIESGNLLFIDQGLEKPYRTQLQNVHLSIKGLTNEPEKKADVELSFESDAKERFHHTGALQLTPLMADGKLAIEGLRPAGFRLYYQTVFIGDIRDGLFDLSTRYSLEQKSDKTELKLTELNAVVRSLNLTETGQRETMWRLPLLAIKETTVDVNNKTVVIGRIECRDGSGFVQRNADGSLNYDRLIKSQPANSPSTGPSKKDDTGWKIEVKQIAVERFNINFEDRAPATPAKINFSDLSIRGENFSNAKNQRGKAIIQTKINNRGLIRLVGTAGAQPTVVNFAVEGRDVDLLPFQSYLENQVNFLLTGGQVGTKGNLTFDASGEGPAKVSYEGNVQITDFATVETGGSQDLLKWKSLNLDGIQFALEPMQLRINEINLADFYSRLILGADGKMNLQKLTAQRTENKDALETKPEKPAEAPAAAPSSERRITIGKINLQGGNVNFSDFFIKPNYTANLTGFQGTISELKPETPGDIEIHAKLDNAAPVDISGKINPLAKDLYLDIKVDATDIDLSPMSPYSGRYVGYGIERGKLTFNVQYKIENRKLSAQNKIILNQLTFGERVESPDATKLPVLLAVALLKDRNGVMDINLPIGGSLDDPQFSVGGIVWQIIVNILVKAVTSPFALLGAAFGGGGGGDELSYIEFDNGRANLNQAAQAKIATLAKALNNRPALNLELSGRVDPATDLEGLKRVGIERKVNAQKLKDLVRRGEALKSVDDVQVDGGEYAQYLKAAYGEESFPKPRNIIGLAQDLPVAEMEKLMMQYAKAGDDDMR
ncbi:MAG: ATPase involved in pili bisis, partial [Deltaproteobacteria bacterium]|nr:ATPase involved in pili bisis [Deltaproteobacteria bacterium]